MKQPIVSLVILSCTLFLGNTATASTGRSTCYYLCCQWLPNCCSDDTLENSTAHNLHEEEPLFPAHRGGHPALPPSSGAAASASAADVRTYPPFNEVGLESFRFRRPERTPDELIALVDTHGGPAQFISRLMHSTKRASDIDCFADEYSDNYTEFCQLLGLVPHSDGPYDGSLLPGKLFADLEIMLKDRLKRCIPELPPMAHVVIDADLLPTLIWLHFIQGIPVATLSDWVSQYTRSGNAEGYEIDARNAMKLVEVLAAATPERRAELFHFIFYSP